MIDECPMTEDCPGYDRDRRMCLLRPGDCEFSPPDSETVLVVETPEAVTPDASTASVRRASSEPRMLAVGSGQG